MKGKHVEQALVRLLAGIEQSYDKRLRGVYRVDRSDILEEPDRSEAEIVVVLSDGPWQRLEESRELARLAFDVLLDGGAYIRVWPVAASEWDHPSRAEFPELVRDLKQRAEPMREAA